MRQRLLFVLELARLAWVYGDDGKRLAEAIVGWAEQQGFELHTHCGLPPVKWDPAEIRAIQALHDQAGHKTFYATSCWEEACQALV